MMHGGWRYLTDSRGVGEEAPGVGAPRRGSSLHDYQVKHGAQDAHGNPEAKAPQG